MEFKELYTKNNIEYGCGRLYGPFRFSKDYLFSSNKKGIKVIIPIMNEDYSHEMFYAEVDEYTFFYDVIYYGKLLYDELKVYITPLKKSYIRPATFEDSVINVVSVDTINNCFDKIEKICREFIDKYTLGFCPERYFPVSYHLNQGYPIFPLVNHILFIFMIHKVFEKLSDGYDSYHEIYNALNINPTASDTEILDTLIDYINIYSMPFYNIASFHSEIIIVDNNIIPITKTDNLFAFAFEVLQNNISTRSFYSFDENSSLHTYIAFRKCSGCSKNIVDLDMDRQNFFAAPKPKTKYCDNCKRKHKIKSSKEYERSIRELYDELKNNVNICNPKLANEIRNLKPKDKETKANLQRLYTEYQNDKEKNNL